MGRLILIACEGGPGLMEEIAARQHFGRVVFYIVLGVFLVLALLPAMRRLACWLALLTLLLLHPGQPMCVANGGDCGMTVRYYSIPYSVVAFVLVALLYWWALVRLRRKRDPNVV